MIDTSLVYEDIWSSMIEVRETPDRGQGVFAKIFIPTGTLLISESAIAYQRMAGNLKDAQAKLVQQLQERIMQDPKSAEGIVSLHSQVGTMHSGPNSHTTFTRLLDSIVKHNSFGSTSNEESTAAVWRRTSRLNHACISNCYRRFDHDVVTVVAKSDIAADEELYISYILCSEPFEARQYYTSTLGFQCECALCILERSDITGQRHARQKILAAYLEEIDPQIDRRGDLDPSEVQQLLEMTKRIFQYIVNSYLSSDRNLYWYDLSRPGPALAVLQVESGLLDDARVTLGLLIDKCNDQEFGAIRLHSMMAALQVRRGAMIGAMNSFALSAQAWLVCNPRGKFREYWTEISSCLATYAGLASTEIARFEDTIGHVFAGVGKVDLSSSA